MTLVIIALAACALIVLVGRRLVNPTDVVAPRGDCGSCDGSPSAKCEQECMMEAATKPIEYYDDEELDAYRGRPSDAYTDEEAEQFREVLYTMRPDEAPGWARSLTLRGIDPPNQVKDELVMLIGEGGGGYIEQTLDEYGNKFKDKFARHIGKRLDD